MARNTRVDPSDGDTAEEGSMPSNSSSQFSEFKGLALIHFAGVSIWRFTSGTHQRRYLNRQLQLSSLPLPQLLHVVVNN